MTLVLGSCTAKKRPAPSSELRAGALPRGDLAAVAAEWARRVRGATVQAKAEDLYVGHGWRHARAAARHCAADLVIVSAGLGAVPGDVRVPSYDLTVIAAADDIRRRVVEKVTAAAWWNAISAERLGGVTLPEALAKEAGLVLAALPETYLMMVTHDLLGSRALREGRLRLFTGANVTRLATDLSNAVMPYDRRLDDPGLGLGGTGDSFAARAMRHFVECLGVLPERGLLGDQAAVSAALEARVAPTRARRARRTDAEISALLRERWVEGAGGPSRLLRILRDDLGVACEQARITRLVRAIATTGSADAS